MILDEVAAYLNGQGHPGAGLGALPGTGDTFALFEYPGERPLHTKDLKAPVLERPRLQVVSRASSYPVGRLKIERIYRLLTGFKGSMGGVRYAQIRALQEPFFLQRDDQGRAMFACNFEIRKDRTPLA